MSICGGGVRLLVMRLHEHPTVALLFHPARRAIYERVARGPASASRIANDLQVPPLEVARLLCELVGARLVAADRVRGRLVYRVDDDGHASARRALEDAWVRALARSFVTAFG
jgi:predicted ArsR family transcriptional regulator